MNACIALWILVAPYQVPGAQPVRHEHYHVKHCEAGAYWPDTKQVNRATLPRTPCELKANDILFNLQLKGLLPGSKEVISYRAVCTSEV